MFSLTANAADNGKEYFPDVPQSHWACDTIASLVQSGIINGMPDGTFNPEGEVTREQFIKMLVVALNENYANDSLKSVFIDVTENTWSKPYIHCAVSSGIIFTDEFENKLFEPTKPITRGMVALWIKNGLGINTNSKCSFSDVTDEKEKQAVAVLEEAGITTGYEDGTFKPQNTLTRAEAAAFIKRTLEKRHSMYTPRQDSQQKITFKENVIVAESTDKTNTFVSADASTMSVAFKNIDKDIKSLKKGDILYIPPCKSMEKGFLGKIESADIKGKNAALTVSNPSLEEVIRDVDLSLEVSPDASCFDGTGDVEVTDADTNTNTPVGKGLEYNAENDIDGYFKFNDDGLFTWTLGGTNTAVHTLKFSAKKGNLTSNFTASIKVFVDINSEGILTDPQYLNIKTNVTTDIHAGATYSKKAEAGVSKNLGRAVVPVAGPIVVTLTPSVELDATGEITVTATADLTSTCGIEFYHGKLSSTSDNSNVGFDFHAEAKGQISVGPKISAELSLCGTPFFDGAGLVNCGITSGILITGETSVDQSVGIGTDGFTYEGHQITPNEKGEIHYCYLCYEGELDLFAEFEGGLSDDLKALVKDITEEEIEDFNVSETGKLTDWHYSTGEWGGPEFEYNACPHKAYQVLVEVTDYDTKEKIPGAYVTIGDKTAVSDGNGVAEFYLESDTYNAVINSEDYVSKTVTFPVYNEKRTVPAKLIWDLSDCSATTETKYKKYNEYGILKCYKDGKLRWTYTGDSEIGTQFSQVSDPYINGPTLYFTSGWKLHALDIRTGKLLWKCGSKNTPVAADEAIFFDTNGDLHLLRNFAEYTKITKDGQIVNRISLGSGFFSYSAENNILTAKYTDDTAGNPGIYVSTIDMLTGTLINTITIRESQN